MILIICGGMIDLFRQDDASRDHLQGWRYVGEHSWERYTNTRFVRNQYMLDERLLRTDARSRASNSELIGNSRITPRHNAAGVERHHSFLKSKFLVSGPSSVLDDPLSACNIVRDLFSRADECVLVGFVQPGATGVGISIHIVVRCDRGAEVVFLCLSPRPARWCLSFSVFSAWIPLWKGSALPLRPRRLACHSTIVSQWTPLSGQSGVRIPPPRSPSGSPFTISLSGCCKAGRGNFVERSFT